MAYNNYNQGYQVQQPRINHFGNNYENARPYYPNQNQQQRPKKSGFKVGEKNGLPYGNGWIATKQGLVGFFIRPKYKGGKTHHYKNKAGLERTICIVEITQGFQKSYNSAIYYPEKRRFVSDSLNLIFTPNGNGYTRSGKQVSGSIVKKPK